MICGLKIGFEPTTNIMWTCKITHLEWARNQALCLKLVSKLKGSPRGGILLTERWLGFYEK